MPLPESSPAPPMSRAQTSAPVEEYLATKTSAPPALVRL